MVPADSAKSLKQVPPGSAWFQLTVQSRLNRFLYRFIMVAVHSESLKLVPPGSTCSSSQ